MRGKVGELNKKSGVISFDIRTSLLLKKTEEGKK